MKSRSRSGTWVSFSCPNISQFNLTRNLGVCRSGAETPRKARASPAGEVFAERNFSGTSFFEVDSAITLPLSASLWVAPRIWAHAPLAPQRTHRKESLCRAEPRDRDVAAKLIRGPWGTEQEKKRTEASEPPQTLLASCSIALHCSHSCSRTCCNVF